MESVTDNKPVEVKGPVVDKITMLLDLSSPTEQKHLYDNIECLMNSGHAKTAPRTRSYGRSIWIRVNDTWDHPIGVQWAPSRDTYSFLRIEKNPTKTLPSLTKPLLDFVVPGGYDRLLAQAHISRIDAAIDVHHRSLEEVLIEVRKFSYSQVRTKSNKTIYLKYGSGESKVSFSFYDKSFEIKKKNKQLIKKQPVPDHEITRFECRYRHHMRLSEIAALDNQFSTLQVNEAYKLEPLLPSYPFLPDACRYRGIKSALAQLSPYERSKLKKGLFDTPPDWWNPEELWASWPMACEELLKPVDWMESMDDKFLTAQTPDPNEVLYT